MNRDRSRSRIVKMPQMHADSSPADVWFELGMIYFEDPGDPSNVCSVTVSEFEERLDAIAEFLLDDDWIKHFVCNKQDASRFISDARELIKEAKNQLHVGMPQSVISDVERERAPVTRRQGFGSGRFTTRASGLIVPQ